MTPKELETRLKPLAFDIVKLSKTFPSEQTACIIQKQLIRSAFSAAANYRAATKTISKQVFVSKLSISFEESDETLFWMECLQELQLGDSTIVEILIKESIEVSSILAASRKTAQAKLSHLQS